jgi:hypothetical protein
MDLKLFTKFHTDGLLSDASLEKIKTANANRLFSIHWELHIILYLGVLMLSSGLGILVYENIDSIGHVAILIFIALISAGGYLYCLKKKLPFSTDHVASYNVFVDYLLVLSCLCFIIFIGYWQYQYNVFGDRFGLVTFIPMLLLFFTAYFFDHLGVLCMAITNLGAWVGIVVTPTRILKANDFNSATIIYTGVVLGILLLAAGKLSQRFKIKQHFAFTYSNFGMNTLFISCLAGLFHFDDQYLLWFLALMLIAGYFYLESVREKSFYFLLMLTLYGYIGLSYVFVRMMDWGSNTDAWLLDCLYFIISGIALILFLIRMNKKYKAS